MKLQLKIVFERVAICVFLAHCGAILIANLPSNPLKEVVFKSFQGTYGDGIFKQNWSFFSPIPKHSNDLSIECADDAKKWSAPRSPFQEALDEFHSNPFSSQERISLLLKDVSDETVAQTRKELAKGIVFNAESIPSEKRLRSLAHTVCGQRSWARFTVSNASVIPFSKRAELRAGKNIQTVRTITSLPMRLSDAFD